jgi:hypothetical protein
MSVGLAKLEAILALFLRLVDMDLVDSLAEMTLRASPFLISLLSTVCLCKKCTQNIYKNRHFKYLD